LHAASSIVNSVLGSAHPRLLFSAVRLLYCGPTGGSCAVRSAPKTAASSAFVDDGETPDVIAEHPLLPGEQRPQVSWTDPMKAFLRCRLGPRMDLRRVDLGGVDLQKQDLSHCDLREADVRGTDLRLASLRSAGFRGIRSEGALWEGAEARTFRRWFWRPRSPGAVWSSCASPRVASSWDRPRARRAVWCIDHWF
jgi:hypothetical protein